jgi:tRNA-2-methylthio-N6-dimethylallyladenosine synthase
MTTYHIWTIGCQMNRAESDRLAACFDNMGYTPVDNAGDADIVVLNSCVVRQSAENRVLNKLSALKSLKKSRPSLTLAVTGCLVDSDVPSLRAMFPHVDHFFKPGEHPPWIEDGGVPVVPRKVSPCTYVTIMQGCDNFCSYCIVPYRRGRERSRPVEEIVNEVQELVCGGAKEVTLLGQNVDSYGRDLPGRPELADLLAEINGIAGLYRIRFLTSHPRDMSHRLIQTVAALEKVCEQINLPVQSGDDEILRRMRRDYTAEHYRQMVSDIRAAIPGVALTTDVIVGFPGETAEQFQHTYDLLKELRFDAVHVAAYSVRPGTIAAREEQDNVPLAEKKARLRQVEMLQAKVAAEINARLLNTEVEVLVEGRNRDKWQGRTRTDKLVFFSDEMNCAGELVDIRITRTSPWSLSGELAAPLSTKHPSLSLARGLTK